MGTPQKNPLQADKEPADLEQLHAAARGNTSAPLQPLSDEDDDLEKKPILPSEAGDSMQWPSSAYFILVVELCERLSFYGATIVFYPYMQNLLEYSQGEANAVYNAFNFWGYSATVLGGYVADTYTGRVRALLLFAGFFTFGLACLFFQALPFYWNDFPEDPGWHVNMLFGTACFFIGLGMGGIKSNVSTLMADQMRNASGKAYSTVFRWFYWCINIGAFVGILTTPILHDVIGDKKILEDGDEDGTGYWASFGLPLITFLTAIAIFYSGKVMNLYVCQPPTGSLLSRCYSASKFALKERAAAKECGRYAAKEHWLDWAAGSKEYAQDAADFKIALSVCVPLLYFPFYWLCYNQMFSNMISQADILDQPSWLSPESLNVVGSATLILMIPIFDKFVFPFLSSRGWNPSPLRRITIGFFLVALAMFYCGALEVFLHQRGRYDENDDYIADEGKTISVWWQIPPYFTIAMSEIFASVGGLEYAYTEAPKSMKSVIMAMFLLTNAAGSIIGIIISPVVKPPNMVYIYFVSGGWLLFLVIPFTLQFRHRQARVITNDGVV
ncbi:putative peptide transporter ptr2 [Diplonema papillatum]|nr:putative peptide transporter ptr2 [Diplonema papillatum]